MTPEEYKAAMHLLLGPDDRHAGGRPVREWLDMLGISESSHKKYSSGAQPVSPIVERLIQALLRIHELEQKNG